MPYLVASDLPEAPAGVRFRAALARPGFASGIFALVYGLSRIAVEFAREQIERALQQRDRVKSGSGHSLGVGVHGVTFRGRELKA